MIASREPLLSVGLSLLLLATLTLLVAFAWSAAGWWKLRVARLDAAHECRRILAADPTVHPATLRQLSRIAERLQQTIERRRREHGIAPAENLAAAMTSTDAFLELTRYAQRLRLQAEDAGAVVAASAGGFGFSEFQQKAPAVEEVATVVRHARQLEALLEQVLVAGPESLELVQREGERVTASAARTAPTGWREALVRPNSERGDDRFAPSDTLLLRSGGAYRSSVFRIGWVGPTETLREILLGLAEGSLPVVVRELRAERAARKPTRETAGAATGPILTHEASSSQFLSLTAPETPANSPLETLADVAQEFETWIEPEAMSFTITIEWIEAVGPADAAGSEGAKA